ncbi:hypothetical protein GCM10027321_10820 [Massilia terrae]|uniref:KTSC domain-containing protein n=1 Tax=Massilia terrae TaxID=1811224 RepID=A0ABT2D238_9BURK|nr:hypothetical protein [Massilia terrae]MCS0660315.1 hypothetical protein [Massilia terrae]
MQRYKNRSSDSGVVAYETGEQSIVIEFRGGDRYLYTAASTGAANIVIMQGLARAGVGLCTFISKVIRKRYARKLA